MALLFKQEFSRLFRLLSTREREDNPELMEKVREIKKKLARVRCRELF